MKIYERRGEQRDLVVSATKLPTEYRVVTKEGMDTGGRIAAGILIVGLATLVGGTAAYVVDRDRPSDCDRFCFFDLRGVAGGAMMMVGGLLTVGGLAGLTAGEVARPRPPDALEVYVDVPGRETATRRVRVSELTEAGLLLDVDTLFSEPRASPPAAPGTAPVSAPAPSDAALERRPPSPTSGGQ